MSAGYSASAQTSAEQRAHEPSMEEILASIRKIIADDQILPLSRRAEEAAAPSAAHAPANPPEPARQDGLASQRPVMRRERFGFRDEPPAASTAPMPRSPRAAIPRPPALDEFDALTRPAEDVPHFAAATHEPAPVAPAPQPQAPVPEAPRLLSPSTDAQLATSFGALNTTVMLQESGVIEDSVKEMLRPMLKQWLDDNLPGIVERLVRQEIERVARGRR